MKLREVSMTKVQVKGHKVGNLVSHNAIKVSEILQALSGNILASDIIQVECSSMYSHRHRH